MQLKINTEDLVLTDDELWRLVRKRLSFTELEIVGDDIIETVESYVTDDIFIHTKGTATKEQKKLFKKQQKANKILSDLSRIMGRK